MSKALEAVESGRVLQYDSNPPRYYRMENGMIYYSDRNANHTKWKPSNATESIFHSDENWTIL